METVSKISSVSNKARTFYNWLLFIYSFLFISSHSYLAHFANTYIERLEVVIGLLLLIVAGILLRERRSMKTFVKANALVWIYLVVRLVTFWRVGFDYSTIRSIFFEAVYLLAIVNALVDGNFAKRYILPLTVWYNLILNVVNDLIYAKLQWLGGSGSFIAALEKYTYLDHKMEKVASTMYVNPNTMGLLTGLSVLIVLILRKETRKPSPVLLTLYLAFSAWTLYLSNCRAAYVALAVAAVVYCIRKVFPRLTAVTATKGFLILCVAVMLCVVGFMVKNEQNDIYNMTLAEVKINELSSSRYFIWKSGWNSNRENLALGCGSLKRQMEERTAYVVPRYAAWLQSLEKRNYDMSTVNKTYDSPKLGPHNGYLGMIFCTGFVGFGLFMVILYLMIRRSKSLKSGNWYLMVIYFLTMNLFESLFILNKYYICLLIFIVLNSNFNAEETE